MLTNPSGKSMEANVLQPEKALFPIAFTGASKVIVPTPFS